MNQLDERLHMLFECVPFCRCAADIGTDHGFLPLALLKAGKCQKAIACDISIPSLQKAVLHSRKEGIPLDCRQSDGVEALGENEADCVIIAGMGGSLISEILERGKEKVSGSVLVLQPMTAVKKLRQYLCGNEFAILKEDMVFQEEKLYHAMIARKGKADQEYDCEIGSGLRNHPLFGQYLAMRKQKEQTILKKMGSFRGKEFEKHRMLLKKIEQEEKQWLR